MSEIQTTALEQLRSLLDREIERMDALTPGPPTMIDVLSLDDYRDAASRLMVPTNQQIEAFVRDKRAGSSLHRYAEQAGPLHLKVVPAILPAPIGYAQYDSKYIGDYGNLDILIITEDGTTMKATPNDKTACMLAVLPKVIMDNCLNLPCPEAFTDDVQKATFFSELEEKINKLVRLVS